MRTKIPAHFGLTLWVNNSVHLWYLSNSSSDFLSVVVLWDKRQELVHLGLSDSHGWKIVVWCFMGEQWQVLLQTGCLKLVVRWRTECVKHTREWRFEFVFPSCTIGNLDFLHMLCNQVYCYVFLGPEMIARNPGALHPAMKWLIGSVVVQQREKPLLHKISTLFDAENVSCFPRQNKKPNPSAPSVNTIKSSLYCSLIYCLKSRLGRYEANWKQAGARTGRLIQIQQEYVFLLCCWTDVSCHLWYASG